MTDEMEVVLINIGKHAFGLPMREVGYIAELPASFRYTGPDTEDYFNFEGTPLHFISSWDALGKVSLYKEFEDIHAMLPGRKQDHLDWMAALEQSILEHIPFGKARSPRECAFGKWYYGFRAEDRKLSLLLNEFDQPHAHIHSLADKLLGLADAGQKDEAMRQFHEAQEGTLKNLLHIFDRTDSLLVSMQRRVALIVERGEDRFALGADMVQTIVTIPAERIKWQKSNDDGAPRQASLFILEDGQIVTCLDWQRFCPQTTFTP